MFNLPQDDDKYQWTNHVKDKMVYYRISESLIKRVIRFPKRVEEGVALNTIAVMQSKQSAGRLKGKMVKKIEEIWVMYQEVKKPRGSTRGGSAFGGKSQKLENETGTLRERILGNRPKMRIISAWRYPGVSLVGKKIPIPDEILQELGDLIE